MTQKILVPLLKNDVAPRFDLATEVWIGAGDPGENSMEERTVVLPQASADALCHLILTEAVAVVICGGIEQEYYDYLRWKRVEVFDSVIGPREQAVKVWMQGKLQPGMTFHRGKNTH